MDTLGWATKQRKKILDGSIFDVYALESSSADGRAGTFIQVDAPNWVTIMPTVLDRLGNLCFVMVKQYRHGSEAVTLEFPAGTVERGEPPKDAALRELLEETGCQPSALIELGEVSPNPAFMNNRMTFFAAEGLECVQKQQLDEHEMIDIELISVNEVIHSMGSGIYDNGVMVAGLLFFLRWKGLINDMNEA
jgi:ADP-ribose pyrophosphatase